MPFYTYECLSCGERFDETQSIKDDPLTDCRSCPGKLRRVVYPSAIIFKGSGFYATDYGKGGSGWNSDAAKAPAAAKDAPSRSIKDKPETKKE